MTLFDTQLTSRKIVVPPGYVMEKSAETKYETEVVTGIVSVYHLLLELLLI